MTIDNSLIIEYAPQNLSVSLYNTPIVKWHVLTKHIENARQFFFRKAMSYFWGKMNLLVPTILLKNFIF